MIDILMIEDNRELAELMKAFLIKEGFSLWLCEDAEQAITWLREYQAKLILLDIMLPGMDGFAFMQKLRQTQDLPVLMLSARSTREDQLMGFTLGADDYVKKPIDPEILAAKIRVLLNRAYGSQTTLLGNYDLRMDIDAHKVFLRNQELELNGKEYELLYCFMKHAGKTLHKEFLFSQVWGEYSESEQQTLTVHIKMLRTKIEEDPRRPQRIVTVWGVGYRYEEL